MCGQDHFRCRIDGPDDADVGQSTHPSDRGQRGVDFSIYRAPQTHLETYELGPKS